MTAERYLAGSTLLVIALSAIMAGAIRVRRRLLPDLGGAGTGVTVGLMAVGALILVGELLGVVGLFKPIPVFLGCVAVGAAGWRLGAPSPSQRAWRFTWPRPRDLIGLGGLVAGTALVAVQWLSFTRTTLVQGMWEVDTLWYHGPFAADFIQQASVTAFHFDAPAGQPIYDPANTELLHAMAAL